MKEGNIDETMMDERNKSQEAYDILKGATENLDARVHLVMDRAALELTDAGLADYAIENREHLMAMMGEEKITLMGRNMYEKMVTNGAIYRLERPQMIAGAELRAGIVGYVPSMIEDNVVTLEGYIRKEATEIRPEIRPKNTTEKIYAQPVEWKWR